MLASACSGLRYSGSRPGSPASVEEVLSVGFRPHRLGHAEIENLGRRLILVAGHQHVRGFEIAVKETLLMGVLHGLADGNEQLQPLPWRQLLFVAIAGDGNALDPFHDEVRLSRGAGAGAEQLGDVGMVHPRQRLPLAFKAGDDLPPVESVPDDLEGDQKPHGFLLLGLKDDAGAALANLLQDLVRTNPRNGRFAAFGMIWPGLLRGLLRRGRAVVRWASGFLLAAALEMRRDLLLHLPLQFGVVVAGLSDVGGAFPPPTRSPAPARRWRLDRYSF